VETPGTQLDPVVHLAAVDDIEAIALHCVLQNSFEYTFCAIHNEQFWTKSLIGLVVNC